MRASVSGFDGRLSALRASRARADVLWQAYEGVAANDRSPERVEKTNALLRDIDTVEREVQGATTAAWGDIRRVQCALRRSRPALSAALMLLLADAVRLCFPWLRR